VAVNRPRRIVVMRYPAGAAVATVVRLKPNEIFDVYEYISRTCRKSRPGYII
jgi:hypothetical protein